MVPEFVCCTSTSINIINKHNLVDRIRERNYVKTVYCNLFELVCSFIHTYIGIKWYPQAEPFG